MQKCFDLPPNDYYPGLIYLQLDSTVINLGTKDTASITRLMGNITEALTE
jgi:hypothetical protein